MYVGGLVNQATGNILLRKGVQPQMTLVLSEGVWSEDARVSNYWEWTVKESCCFTLTDEGNIVCIGSMYTFSYIDSQCRTILLDQADVT